MHVAFQNDRFTLPRLPQGIQRQLALRRLPGPKWDRDEHVWWYGEDAAELASVQFLVEAYRFEADLDVRDRLAQLGQVHGSPTAHERLAALLERLRPYQREGVEFAVARKKVLIADAMGLGKSLQALAALESLDAYPALVVCPASIRLGWLSEVLKWMPWRSCQIVESGRDTLDPVDILVISPELLASHLDDLRFQGLKGIVFDEVHYFKNPRAKRTRHAVDLAEGVAVRIGLTGTPIQNRRQDLVQQLSLLGQLEEVLHIYRGVLPHWWTPAAGPLRWDHAMNALDRLPRDEVAKRLRDVCMIRRTKHTVAKDLPEFERVRRDVQMADRRGYQKAESAFVTWVDRLREADESRWGLERLAGRQHLSRLRREAALGKTAAVAEWAAEMRDAGERVLFFAYHKAVVAHLAKELPGKVAPITGDTHPHERRRIIDDFQAYDAIVATMDSLGQGIDGLQHNASHVAFVELDWTPTKHEQCEGRLHRIGQTAPVTAWYFTAEDTIEGAMMRVIDAKWGDVQAIVNGRPPDAFMAKMVDALVHLDEGEV